METCNKKIKKLKSTLYGKFGNSINLEEWEFWWFVWICLWDMIFVGGGGGLGMEKVLMWEYNNTDYSNWVIYFLEIFNIKIRSFLQNFLTVFQIDTFLTLIFFRPIEIIFTLMIKQWEFEFGKMMQFFWVLAISL
jgi:hypothetical protein